jgi:hypothetical protein
MALTSTALTNPITEKDDTILVTAVTGAAEGGVVKLGNREYAFIVSVDTTAKTVKLRSRGSFGTTAVAHAASVPVVFGAVGDMPLAPAAGRSVAPSPNDPEVITLTAAGAIPVPTRPTKYLIGGSGALALTLASPSAAIDGVEVDIISTTAAAHTVTYTAGFKDDTTASDVATFTAAIGTTLQLVASGGKWRLRGVTPLAVNGNITFA